MNYDKQIQARKSCFANKSNWSKLVEINYRWFYILKTAIMVSHPRFMDTNSGLEQTQAIHEYIGVQRIEGHTYDTKQVSQLFLKYLNKPLYQKAKILI
mgnify:CR=1 FL=1